MLNAHWPPSPFLSVALLWLLASLLAWPVGEFPLDDDWAYAKAVEQLVENGTYRVNDWPAMTLFTQVLWGALFAKVFGFSFWALRLSTIVLGIFGLAALDFLLERLSVPAWQRAFALAWLAFNPLFFLLSLTFMTDVSFVSLLLLTSCAYWQALQKGHWKWWALAALGAVLCVLLRQPGLLLPAAFFGAIVLRRPRLGLLLRSGFILALSFASLQAYIFWQESSGTLPAAFSRAGQLLSLVQSKGSGERAVLYGGFVLLYLGLFSLPMLLLLPWRRPQRGAWLVLLPLGGLVLFTLSATWGRGTLGNLIFDLGLGTVAMPGEAVHPKVFQQLPAWSRTAIAVLGWLSALLLSGQIALRLRAFLLSVWPLRKATGFTQQTAEHGGQTFKLALALFLLAYGLFLLPNYFFFDRYLLPLVAFLPLLLPLGKRAPSRFRVRAAIGALAVMGIFSVTGTHDYFAWNRARWSALEALMEQGVSPKEIDGGIEFNAWLETGELGPRGPYGKSWWFVTDDTYALSFAPYSNYCTAAQLPYSKWLPPGRDTLYLLKRPAWRGTDTLHYSMEPSAAAPRPPFAQFGASDLQPLVPGREAARSAYEMGAAQEYALTHQFYPVQPGDELSVSFWSKPIDPRLLLIASAPDADGFHYGLPLLAAEQPADDWTLTTALLRVPNHFPSDTLSLYFWKQSDAAVRIDDYQIVWRQAGGPCPER